MNLIGGNVSEILRKSEIQMDGLTDSNNHKIKVDSLRAYFGKLEAIKNISLDFYENKITAIIGPSGCGKSTLLRCLNRLHEEVGGTIRVIFYWMVKIFLIMTQFG